MPEQNNSRILPKWLVITVVCVITFVILVAGGLFAYNQLTLANANNSVVSEAITEPDTNKNIEPLVDDSGALDALGGAMGGLFSYIETYSGEDCSYLSLLTSQLSMSTPLDSYRGTYEKIKSNLVLITSVCPYDPSNSDAVYFATETRKDVVKILEERKWLGSSSWGGPLPVPGKQVQG